MEQQSQGERAGYEQGEIRKQAFMQAMEALRAHNQEHSWGKMLGKHLVEGIEAADREEKGEMPDFQMTASDGQEMDREILGITNEEALKAIGLALSPVRKDAILLSSAGLNDSVGEVRARIQDGNSFVSFLEGLIPQSANEPLQQALDQVAGDLYKEALEVDAKSEEGIEALACLRKVAGIMNRLGVCTENCRELKELGEHVAAGNVREFIAAKKIGLYDEVGGNNFGPSEWQTDATKDFLDNRWGRVLEVLEASRQNPRARELFEDLMGRAWESLNYAKADWQRLKTERAVDGYGTKYGKGFDEIFERISLELNILNS